MTHVAKQFAPPALPTPGVGYSAHAQSQLNNILRLYFNQLDNVLGPIIAEVNANNLAAITTVTGNYTINNSDCTVLCDATGGNITITLPAADSADERRFSIKKIDSSANLVTITPSGANTVDGESSVIIELQWVNVVVQSNGTNWYIL